MSAVDVSLYRLGNTVQLSTRRTPAQTTARANVAHGACSAAPVTNTAHTSTAPAKHAENASEVLNVHAAQHNDSEMSYMDVTNKQRNTIHILICSSFKLHEKLQY